MYELRFWVLLNSRRPAATEKVEDDRDDCEDQQQVNEEACGMEDYKAAYPSQNQHQRENEKHGNPSFPVTDEQIVTSVERERLERRFSSHKNKARSLTGRTAYFSITRCYVRLATDVRLNFA
jgi:hypothetical protein